MNDLKPKIQLNANQLLQAALDQHEGLLSERAALVVSTGKRTGRSPKDRFIVKDATTAHSVNWGSINLPIENETFQHLWQRAEKHFVQNPGFVNYYHVGDHPDYKVPVKVTTELAWHQLFVHHLFLRESFDETTTTDYWEMLNAPSLKTKGNEDGVASDATLIINFTERKILLLGLQYAGEMKKAMFTVLNYQLPEKNVLPMHCAANAGENGDVALFFGLSGTGKTTLSSDPERYLMGDDEHGWHENGVFNFEGGCYAKCIKLSKEKEPVIWDAIRDGAIMENVVLNDDKTPNFDDDSLTENTRAAYPRDFIPLRVPLNRGENPKAVIFLCCDLYGVLPPVALLNQAQAAYYFLSGYTALVGSTEVGSVAGVTPTFSTCFGAPFFPRRPEEYAVLLIKRLKETGAPVYLVNTGWTGGAYGKGGERFPIPITREIIRAILADEIRKAPLIKMPGFEFMIPTKLSHFDASILDPRSGWSDTKEFLHTQKQLIERFKENFSRFNIPDSLIVEEPK